MSHSSKNLILPNDKPNLHLLAIEQRFHSLRRSSDGNFLAPGEAHRYHVSRMDQIGMDRSHSVSPSRGQRSRGAATLPVDCSLACYSPKSRSGTSSPCSDCESSIASCSELVQALEALTIELQQKKEMEERREEGGEKEDSNGHRAAGGRDSDTLKRCSIGIDDTGNNVADGKSPSSGEGTSTPVRSLPPSSATEQQQQQQQQHGAKTKLDMAEREKILNECKNQIKSLTAANKSLEKKVLELEDERNLALGHKAPHREGLKCWPKARGGVQDLEKKIAVNDHYVDPSEIIAVLLDSERRYVTGLTLLHSEYQQPMRMLSSFKPDTLNMKQLNTIFLNCTELLVLHRVFYEDLTQIPLLSESAQVDKLFEVLENTFPAFGQYTSFLNTHRPQNVQKELRQLKTKPQFETLLRHCERNCEGISLTTLLNLPTERLSDYSELLTHFLNPRVRSLPEDACKRAEALIRFLRNLRYDLGEEKSEWDHTLEKIKLLQKLPPDVPMPMEIFNSNVRLVKQGTLTQVMGKKEMLKHCILFNNYIALAQAKDNQYRIMENRMIPLYGAQLHKCVDIEGQAIASDLQSGRSEDRLAFGLSLVGSDNLYLRAARPNEWKQWVELLEKCIQESQQLQLESEMDVSNYRPLYPIDSGPKIAAASLEKLFQQLTSPHFEHHDFMRVFLLTHTCFTTSQEVLTALLNCIKSPEHDVMSQTSDSDLFLFNMEELSGSGSDCVSASPSLYTINTDSETGSPGPSPSVVRRSVASSTHTSSISPSPNSQLRTNGNSARKAIHSAASFASTDSDVSPHTSAIVVDNAPISTKDGWAEAGDPELTNRKKAASLPGKVMHISLSPSTPPHSTSEGDYYAKLFPTNQVCIAESEPSDAEADAHPEKTTPIITPLTSLDKDSIHAMRRKTRRSLSESGGIIHSIVSNSEEDTLKATIVGTIAPSERMHQELDEASKMMSMQIQSLDTDFSKRQEGEGQAGPLPAGPGSSGDVIKRRSRMLSSKMANRLGVVSSTLSTSEPDLTGCGLEEEEEEDDSPPSLPPRDPDMTFSPTGMTKEDGDLVMQSLYGGRIPRIVRRGSEHSLLTYSLNESSEGTGVGSKDKKSKMADIFKPGRKTKKKADTLSGRGSGRATPSLLSSPVRSSAQFGSSPTHSAINPSASFTISDLNKTPVKKASKWNNIRQRMNKRFNRSGSANIEAVEELNRHRVKPQRSQSIPSNRKCGVYASGGRSASIVGGDDVVPSLPDGGVGGGSVSSVRGRMSSTSYSANSVNLVSKIFSVLGCWVDEYFEDFQGNEDLTQSLSDYLDTLISKTTCDTLEYHRAHQLLEGLKRKIKYTSSPPANCPFPLLLSRVIRLTPEVLSMYDWENPDKLMKGREIDLSKSLPKESMYLRMIAEQLTLMEFAVYAVIQRKELLNCNWKKPNKEELSPNLCRLIRRTNDMTSWVATEILLRKTPAQRAVVIEHFIQIANYCYKHNDLHCALNITIALGSACIKSLRQTWSEVDKKCRHRFDKLKDSMDYHGKCKKMRENLERLTQETLSKTNELPPALPYIGAYLDLIYTIEMQSKTYDPNGLVNFAKMTKLAEVVTRVLQYQDVGFNFEPKPDLMAYVTASKRLSENDLFELSMTVEPPSS